MSSDPAAAGRARQAIRPLLILGGVILVLALAQWLRGQMGIEWSAESIRDRVGGLGWVAPFAFVLLVTFRQLLALPSVLVLTSAGLLFGAVSGTLLGGLAMTLNACFLFGVARLMGRDWVLPKIHERWPDFERRSQTAGPPFLAFTTGHPMGVLTPFHFGAGITPIRWPVFVGVVAPATLLRAGLYAFLGSQLLDFGSPRFWVATGVILLVSLAPLAHPGVRQRLLSRDSGDADSAAQ